MPIISQFYGITIRMYLKEGERHHKKHIHISYNEYNAIYDIEGKIIEGDLPKKQKKMIEAWIAIHEKELKELWNLSQQGKGYFKINPLK